MLKLVHSRKTIHKRFAAIEETEKNPSLQYIDQLINQIKYIHISEVWNGRLNELVEVHDKCNSKKKALS